MDELIQTILSKYDDSIKQYSDIIKHPNIKYLINQGPIDKTDGKLKFESNDTFYLNSYFLGSYNVNEKIWIWNWCYPLRYENIQLGNTLVNYALSFDKNKLDRQDFQFIRSILINSRIKIERDYNFEILMGLIMYITNIKVIVPIKKTINNIETIYFYGTKEPSNKLYLD